MSITGKSDGEQETYTTTNESMSCAYQWRNLSKRNVYSFQVGGDQEHTQGVPFPGSYLPNLCGQSVTLRIVIRSQYVTNMRHSKSFMLSILSRRVVREKIDVITPGCLDALQRSSQGNPGMKLTRMCFSLGRLLKM